MLQPGIRQNQKHMPKDCNQISGSSEQAILLSHLKAHKCTEKYSHQANHSKNTGQKSG